VVKYALALAENPQPAGCKKLKGFKDQWRIRAGDWRVLYIIDVETKTVSGSSGRGTDHCRSSGTFLKTPVDVADHFIRVDLAPRDTMKVGNCSRRDLEPFELLLPDCVSHGPHVALNVLLG
jgi:hypothetical protein